MTILIVWTATILNTGFFLWCRAKAIEAIQNFQEASRSQPFSKTAYLNRFRKEREQVKKYMLFNLTCIFIYLLIYITYQTNK